MADSDYYLGPFIFCLFTLAPVATKAQAFATDLQLRNSLEKNNSAIGV